jgi:energy-converting hydrogenase Eha subunit A
MCDISSSLVVAVPLLSGTMAAVVQAVIAAT